MSHPKVYGSVKYCYKIHAELMRTVFNMVWLLFLLKQKHSNILDKSLVTISSSSSSLLLLATVTIISTRLQAVATRKQKCR